MKNVRDAVEKKKSEARALLRRRQRAAQSAGRRGHAAAIMSGEEGIMDHVSAFSRRSTR